jgi:hypothetical protein
VLTDTPSGGDPTKMYLLMDRFGVSWDIIEPNDIITIECGSKKIVESNWQSTEWRAAIWMNDVCQPQFCAHQLTVSLGNSSN